MLRYIDDEEHEENVESLKNKKLDRMITIIVCQQMLLDQKQSASKDAEDQIKLLSKRQELLIGEAINLNESLKSTCLCRYLYIQFYLIQNEASRGKIARAFRCLDDYYHVMY